MFQHLGISLEAGVRGTLKQTFFSNILVECECAKGKAVKLSRISELLAEKERLR